MKTLMTITVVAAALGVAAAGISAQAIPDLSGTWIIDAGKSDPAPPTTGRGRGNTNQMVITKSDDTLTVTLGGANYIYNLDGSERTGPPGGETKSKIASEGGKLVVTWKREYFAGPDKGYLTSTGRDTYTLAGTALTVERMTALPGEAPQTRKTVYNRAP